MGIWSYLSGPVVGLLTGPKDTKESPTARVAGLFQSVPAGSMSDTPRRARFADSVVFGILGAMFATWAVRIPAVSRSLALSEGDIGIALLGLAIGSVIGLMTSGVLVSRYGGQRVIRVGLGIYSLALLFVAFANGLFMLVGVIVLFGFGKGVIDVAANAQGVRIEQSYSGQIMGSFHALFSGGGLVGAGFGAVATSFGLSVRVHFALISVSLLIIGFVASMWLLPKDGTTTTETTVTLPSRRLVGFCAIGFCALFIEGVGNDWSAVLLEASGASATIATLGFAAFSVTMMLGRFLADQAVAWTGPKRFLRIAAVISAFGIVLTLFSRPIIILFGFGILGLGLAGIMPIALSVAGKHDPAVPAERAIAAVSTAGYGGFAVGPVMIGFIAETTSLRAAFVPALGLTVLIVVFTGVLPTGIRTASDSETPA